MIDDTRDLDRRAFIQLRYFPTMDKFTRRSTTSDDERAIIKANRYIEPELCFDMAHADCFCQSMPTRWPTGWRRQSNLSRSTCMMASTLYPAPAYKIYHPYKHVQLYQLRIYIWVFLARTIFSSPPTLVEGYNIGERVMVD